MVKQAPKCPKCKSQMVAEHGKWICLNDAEELESSGATRQYYETNKDVIIETYHQHGAKALKAEWGINGSSWFSLRKRWGVELVTKPAAVAPRSENGASPQLPAWRDDWPEAVMLKWLDILDSLKGAK